MAQGSIRKDHPFDESGLVARSFQGFHTFKELRIDEVPKAPGVYVVLRSVQFAHLVLEESVGGRFKHKDPSADSGILTERMNYLSDTLYIGKADAGPKANRGLQKRVSELAKFGNGLPVGHWGGRYLWQLSESTSLRVAWKETHDRSAREAERELLEEFLDLHGQLPFANIRR